MYRIQMLTLDTDILKTLFYRTYSKKESKYRLLDGQVVGMKRCHLSFTKLYFTCSVSLVVLLPGCHGYGFSVSVVTMKH